jgi:hypothetical protein
MKKPKNEKSSEYNETFLAMALRRKKKLKMDKKDVPPWLWSRLQNRGRVR